MPFHKDPVQIGDIYESIPGGKDWLVIATGIRTDWMLRRLVGGVRRIERSTEELSDPHKWRAGVSLDELGPRAREEAEDFRTKHGEGKWSM